MGRRIARQSRVTVMSDNAGVAGPAPAIKAYFANLSKDSADRAMAGDDFLTIVVSLR